MANIILPQVKVLDTISDSATMLIEENGEIRRYNVTSLSQVNKPKAGFIYPLASKTVPEGFLLCNGAECLRTEYSELFAAIGTMYGSGDGSTTFNVPNLQTRVPVGAGDGYELGDVGGEVEHILTINEMPQHQHTAYEVGTTKDSANTADPAAYTAMRSVDRSNLYGSISYTNSSGNSQPHNNMQPYIVVNYIIATGKNTGVSVADIITGAQALPLGVEYGGTGATNITDIHKNLGIKANARNLLDNSDFRNPVNQRGATSYAVKKEYTIDRWYDDTAMVTQLTVSIEWLYPVIEKCHSR